METRISTSWIAVAGAENAEVSIFHPPKHAHQQRCEIYVDTSGPLDLVKVVSSARTCELLERRAGDHGQHSYVSTIRGHETQQEGVYRLEVDIQSLCQAKATNVVLRMLSLQEKGIFCLHSLALIEDTDDQARARPAAPSQIEAVRKLLEDAQAGCNGQPADSKQQLMASIAKAAMQQKALPSTPLFSLLPNSLLQQLSNSSSARLPATAGELAGAMLRGRGAAGMEALPSNTLGDEVLQQVQQDGATSLTGNRNGVAHDICPGGLDLPLENGSAPCCEQEADGQTASMAHLYSKMELRIVQRLRSEIGKTIDKALQDFEKRIDAVITKQLQRVDSHLTIAAQDK